MRDGVRRHLQLELLHPFAITFPLGRCDRRQSSIGQTVPRVATRTVGDISEHVSILGNGMQDDEDNEASATDRIVEVTSGETVGLLYIWEDGVKQPLWFNGKRQDVVVIGIPDADEFNKD